ncbi:hypothetical protein B0J12DRAFT_140688 [Macrophomina phaseolina]|uniref:Uncharacterized protein n=1 Tax=Macrophomina phaseolina TaxID=35725 RepID=A0ABQ8G5P0_9PEZI|nr:hypothetical protein B0J12DRAFT_140688 [Macrophomina phaseolina]
MQYFTLRAWPLLVTADGPARADVIGIKRPGNAVSPYTVCAIKATPSVRLSTQASATTSATPSIRPVVPPQASRRGTYYVPHTASDFKLPVRRNLRSQLARCHLIDNAFNRTNGLVRRSALLELPTLHFPRSFPVDIMHCLLLNNIRRLWSF